MKHFVRNKDIVIIGLQPWYTDIGSNCKSIALEFAKTNRVLYINIPLNRNVIRTEKSIPEIRRHLAVIQGEKDPLEQVSPSLWNYYPKRIHESINWIPHSHFFSIFNHLNNKRFSRDIKDACQRLGFENYILFNDNDIFRGHWLKSILKPSLYVYYCRDFLTSSGYFKKHGKTEEPLHIATADLALTNSTQILQYLQKFNDNSHYVGQGCDLELFDANVRHNCPKELENIKGPIIGYVGNLTTRRLDISILLNIASQRPEWNFVLVGPEDEVFQNSELHHFKNVIFTGKKEIALLPEYMQAFDVCINPQLINQLTIGNYPLKIDEYLAMGKPIVATNTLAMEMFNKYCYLAINQKDYLNLIEKALQENSINLQKERIVFANEHSWKNSVRLIFNYIENTLLSKASNTRNLQQSAG